MVSVKELTQIAPLVENRLHISSKPNEILPKYPFLHGLKGLWITWSYSRVGLSFSDITVSRAGIAGYSGQEFDGIVSRDVSLLSKEQREKAIALYNQGRIDYNKTRSKRVG